jgi:hypothetical protein
MLVLMFGSTKPFDAIKARQLRKAEYSNWRTL